MSMVVELEAARHGGMRIDPRPGAWPGLLVPIGLTEVPLAATDFPLFLAKDASTGGFEIAALIGLEDARNLFWDGDRWHATYVPELAATAPFRLAAGAATGLAVDRTHARIGAAGERLFAEDGTPQPIVAAMRARLEALVTAIGDGRRAAAELAAAGAVQAVAVGLRFADGGEHDLDGLYVPDAAVLARLEEAAVVRLHRSGALAAAAVLSASLGQLERLRQLHNARSTRALAEASCFAA